MKPKILIMDVIHEKGIEILSSFAEIEDGSNISRAELLTFIDKFDALVIKSGNIIDKEILQAAKRLRVIGRAGTGLDNIDLKTAEEKKIEIICSPSGNVCSVAEYIVCMMIFLSHRLHEAHIGALKGDFRRANWRGRNLNNLNVGLIGLGRIGTAVVKKLTSLNNRILAYDPFCTNKDEFIDKGVTFYTNLYEMLKHSNIVSLQLPLTSSTYHLLDKKAFSKMPRGTIIINASRGALIDDDALNDAFERGIISFAALDSLDPDPPYNEPPTECFFKHRWIDHPKVYYTPHIAAGTEDALQEVAVELALKMKGFFYNGKNSF